MYEEDTSCGSSKYVYVHMYGGRKNPPLSWWLPSYVCFFKVKTDGDMFFLKSIPFAIGILATRLHSVPPFFIKAHFTFPSIIRLQNPKLL